MTFTANGEHLVGGSTMGVRVWRVKDGNQVAMMPAKGSIIQSVVASNDGRWIAAGTFKGGAFVWDATAHEQVFLVHEGTICHVDFSPDSTRLVVADDTGAATIWDIAEQRKVRTFGDNWQRVKAAKYSPRGDRIATATILRRDESVQVWDSNDGRLLVDVKVPVNGLLWCNNHLFVQTKDSKIKRIAGSTVSEWPVPCTNPYTSHVTQLQHGTFIACSANKTVTFWDTETHTQLGLIQHTHSIRSIASSSDGQLLAIAAERKIAVKELFRFVSVHFVPSIFTTSQHHLVFQDPELGIDSAALNARTRDEFTNADALLSATILTASENGIHHLLASRALVRVRLGEWDAALDDAQEVRVTPLTYLDPDVVLNQVHQNSPISRRLRCTLCGSRWKRGKARGNSGVRHCIPEFPFRLWYPSPSHQGT